MRLLSLSTLTGALFSLSFRPGGSGYFALAGAIVLVIVLVTERKPWRGALAAGMAWLGLGLPAVEGAVAGGWWALPALLGLLSLGWFITGALYVWLRRRLTLSAALVVLPVLLTATEFMTSQRLLFGDTAVGLLAYTQADTPLLSLAPWSGTSTLTLGLLLCAAGIYAFWLRKWSLSAWLVLPVVLLMMLPVPGTFPPITAASLTVGAVQGAQSSVEHVLAAYDERIAARLAANYEHLVEEAVAGGAELVVLGETILPSGTDPANLPQHLRSMLAAAPVTIAGSREYSGQGIFNSAFMWSGADLHSVYRKRALVPVIEGSYTRGSSSAPVMAQGTLIGLAICLDTIHANLIRSSVAEGAELLVFITDDTFAGFTATPYVHTRTAALRAAETARATVFVNEWGPSANFDRHGLPVATLGMGSAGVLTAALPLNSGITPFVRFGDLLGLLSLVSTAGLVLLATNGRRSGLLPGLFVQ